MRSCATAPGTGANVRHGWSGSWCPYSRRPEIRPGLSEGFAVQTQVAAQIRGLTAFRSQSEGHAPDTVFGDALKGHGIDVATVGPALGPPPAKSISTRRALSAERPWTAPVRVAMARPPGGHCGV